MRLSGNGGSFDANANRTTTNVERLSIWIGVYFQEGNVQLCKVLQRMCQQQLARTLSHVPRMDPQMLQVGPSRSNAQLAEADNLVPELGCKGWLLADRLGSWHQVRVPCCELSVRVAPRSLRGERDTAERFRLAWRCGPNAHGQSNVADNWPAQAGEAGCNRSG
jgi:hypothetical protein